MMFDTVQYLVDAWLLYQGFRNRRMIAQEAKAVRSHVTKALYAHRMNNNG